MVEYQARLTETFGALSAPIRLGLLEELQGGSCTVLELAEPFDVSLNAVSKHLKVLEQAGLVRRDIQGREHHISLSAEPLREVGDYVRHFQRFWEERLDALEGYLVTRREEQASREPGGWQNEIDPNNKEKPDDSD